MDQKKGHMLSKYKNYFLLNYTKHLMFKSKHGNMHGVPAKQTCVIDCAKVKMTRRGREDSKAQGE